MGVRLGGSFGRFDGFVRRDKDESAYDYLVRFVSRPAYVGGRFGNGALTDALLALNEMQMGGGEASSLTGLSNSLMGGNHAEDVLRVFAMVEAIYRLGPGSDTAAAIEEVDALLPESVREYDRLLWNALGCFRATLDWLAREVGDTPLGILADLRQLYSGQL